MSSSQMPSSSHSRYQSLSPGTVSVSFVLEIQEQLSSTSSASTLSFFLPPGKLSGGVLPIMCDKALNVTVWSDAASGRAEIHGEGSSHIVDVRNGCRIIFDHIGLIDGFASNIVSCQCSHRVPQATSDACRTWSTVLVEWAAPACGTAHAAAHQCPASSAQLLGRAPLSNV
jgi:hypothetical protein